MCLERLLSSSPPKRTKKPSWVPVPKGYKFVRILGKGGFGLVMECMKEETGEHVGIKVSEMDDLDHEAEILKELKRHNSDEANIIEFKGDVLIENKRLLVLEKLDINLWEYVRSLSQPMELENIRTVIQQLAVALNTTKSAGIIHADVKINNIMMVDHVKQPFRVKLIDFGLAMHTSEARAGMLLQTPPNRAPEIFLGLPFSEAIDVWSLGCVMARMVAHTPVFMANSTYGILQQMICLLGLPPQHLIQAGRRSRSFFTKMPSGLWRLKTQRDDEPKPSTSMSTMVKSADPETRSHLTGLPDEDRDFEEKNREKIKAEKEKDGYPENIQDRKNSEDNTTPVKQEINECEDTKDSEDKDTEATDHHEDTKDSEDKDTEATDHHKDTKDSEDKDTEATDHHEDTKDSDDDKDTKASDNNEAAEDNEKEQSKAKKKKNCFQRIFSWIKKKFCCCCCVSDGMD
ncbi:homeodomain-interacting protein kinase 1-like [Acanthochromis polyacanthus]|uniref:homeodomain-interacting protein kinase 1-like n=1 Tax=Acanthochromis polyacanthus TaxID=80966 RepID=UPI00223485A9|nr:homeodomain-interacting protein kinase 1-like [Acanthochromis polyacanthus]